MGPGKSLHPVLKPSLRGEGIREVEVSVARVLLLQVSGQGRGLRMFHNSLKMAGHSLTMETLYAVSQTLQVLSASPPEARRRTHMSTQSPTWPKAMPGWLNATLICGTFATLLWLEHRRPLRRQTERKLTRNSRNLAMVALSAMTIWLTERPVAGALAQFVEREQWGLVQSLRLPPGSKWSYRCSCSITRCISGTS